MAANGWRIWVLGVAIVVLFASGTASAAIVHLSDDTEGWDSRVLPLAEFVADERGLEFDHPVPVDFLDDDAFNREVAGDGGVELTEADEEEAERFSRLFRAVGLVSGEIDMAGSNQQMVEEGLLALYNPDEERILVRGTDMNVSLRATLVHELTHALQDQHFDLTRIDEFETSGEELAFRALAEGDADRIENLYIDDLSPSEQDEYDDDSGEAPDLEDIPPALIAYFGAPYALGDGFVGVIDELDGQSGVDDAFEDPPTTDENLMDPFTYLAGDGAAPVDSPELADDEEEFDSGDWGAMTWLLMLGARIDPHVALRATDGWGGDAYVAYERGGTTCVRVAYVGETPDDTAANGVRSGRVGGRHAAGVGIGATHRRSASRQRLRPGRGHRRRVRPRRRADTCPAGGSVGDHPRVPQSGCTGGRGPLHRSAHRRLDQPRGAVRPRGGGRGPHVPTADRQHVEECR